MDNLKEKVERHNKYLSTVREWVLDGKYCDDTILAIIDDSKQLIRDMAARNQHLEAENAKLRSELTQYKQNLLDGLAEMGIT